MKCNRVNSTLTFSAALAGLALFVLTPTAHGHGNNPKFTDTEPDLGTTPPPPPENGGPQPNTDVEGAPMNSNQDALGSMLDPGGLISFDPMIQKPADVLSQVIAEPGPVDIVVNPALDLAPQIAKDVFDSSGAVSISGPITNVVPAPGTLALLGLAAAAAGRRRRRLRG